MEFRYIAFSPNAYSRLIYEHQGKLLHGSWVEGVYFQHTKTMPSPFQVDGEVDLVDNIEHYLICDGMADWNLPVPIEQYKILPETLCLITPYIVNNEHVVVNDVVSFKYNKNIVEYEGVGKMVYVNNRFMIYAQEYFDVNDVMITNKIGNVIKQPHNTFTFFVQPKNFTGKITASTLTYIPFRTHTLIITDQDNKKWSFGHLDLSDDKRFNIWHAHMKRMFNLDLLDNTVPDVNVNLYFENGQLVALYVQDGGMKILDLRNIFEELS